MTMKEVINQYKPGHEETIEKDGRLYRRYFTVQPSCCSCSRLIRVPVFLIPIDHYRQAGLCRKCFKSMEKAFKTSGDQAILSALQIIRDRVASGRDGVTYTTCFDQPLNS